MIRKSMLFSAALLAALAAIPASARPDSVVPVSTQAAALQVDAGSGELLSPGERFVGDSFSIEAQDLYTARSLTRTGYDEVRVPVTFVNDSADTMLYSAVALAGNDGFPEVQLRDSAGVAHAIDTRSPGNAAAPGSNVTVLPPGLPAHWTLGFQVPSAFTSSLGLEVVQDGTVVATFDLTGDPQPLAGYDMPAGAVAADFGDTVTWSNGVELTFSTVETVACGAPEIVHSAVSTIIEVTVGNTDVVDQFFPEVRHPSVVGYAIWADGSSGRFVGATTVFPAFPEDATVQEMNELMADGVRSIPNVRASHEIVVPPGFDLNLGLVFQTPRDSRFVDVTSDPIALWLTSPEGSEIWVDLTSAPVSNFEVPEDFQTDVACAFGQPTLFLNTADEPQAVVSLDQEQPEETETETATVGG